MYLVTVLYWVRMYQNQLQGPFPTASFGCLWYSNIQREVEDEGREFTVYTIRKREYNRQAGSKATNRAVWRSNLS